MRLWRQQSTPLKKHQDQKTDLRLNIQNLGKIIIFLNIHYANLIKSPFRYFLEKQQFNFNTIIHLIWGWRSLKLNWDFARPFDIPLDIQFDVPLQTENACVTKLSLFQHLAIDCYKNNTIFCKELKDILQDVKGQLTDNSPEFTVTC